MDDEDFKGEEIHSVGDYISSTFFFLIMLGIFVFCLTMLNGIC